MTYVRNAWYVAAWSHEIKTETPFAMTILGERVVIWRTASGALHALEDRCVHRLAPLSLGRCEGEHIRIGIPATPRCAICWWASPQGRSQRTSWWSRRQVMPTAHDRGVTLYNRLVEKLTRTERQETFAAW